MRRLPWNVLWWAGMLWSVPFVIVRVLIDITAALWGKASWTLIQPGLWAMGVAMVHLTPADDA